MEKSVFPEILLQEKKEERNPDYGGKNGEVAGIDMTDLGGSKHIDQTGDKGGKSFYSKIADKIVEEYPREEELEDNGVINSQMGGQKQIEEIRGIEKSRF